MYVSKLGFLCTSNDKEDGDKKHLRLRSDGLQFRFWHDSAEDRKVGDLQTKLGSVLSPPVSTAAWLMRFCWERLEDGAARK